MTYFPLASTDALRRAEVRALRVAQEAAAHVPAYARFLRLAGYDPAKAPEFVWPMRLQEAKRQIRAAAQSRDRTASDPDGRETRDIAGWQVHISRKLLSGS